MSLAPIVRALPDQRLPCSATGTPPIYKALIRNSTVLMNTTETASIVLHEEGNYSCVATSKYGTDRKEFSVIFTGKTFCNELNTWCAGIVSDCNVSFSLLFLACGSQCAHESGVSWGNTLSCKNSMSPLDIIKCAPTITEKL